MTESIAVRGVAMVCGVVLLSACGGPKSYVVLLESPDSERPSVITVSNEQGTRTLDTPGEYVGLAEAPAVAPRRAPQPMIERDFGAALAVEPPAPERFLLYFDSGSTELTAESARLVGEILVAIKARAAPEVAIVGHADTAGSADANAALAARRAAAIRELVLAAGIEASLVEVSAHGEREPLIATADGVAEPRNRRVEVVIR